MDCFLKNSLPTPLDSIYVIVNGVLRYNEFNIVYTEQYCMGTWLWRLSEGATIT